MTEFLLVFVGLLGGGFLVFVILLEQGRRARNQIKKAAIAFQAIRLKRASAESEISAKRKSFEEESAREKEEVELKLKQIRSTIVDNLASADAEIERKRREIKEKLAAADVEIEIRRKQLTDKMQTIESAQEARFKSDKEKLENEFSRLKKEKDDFSAQKVSFDDNLASADAEIERKRREIKEKLAAADVEIEIRRKQLTDKMQTIESAQEARFKSDKEKLENEFSRLKKEKDDFSAQKVSFDDLKKENTLVKADIRRVYVNLNKLELDCDRQRQEQDSLDKRCQELGSRYLKENIKWISSSVNANNYAACKQRLLDIIERCRGIGLQIASAEEQSLVADLKSEFEKAVKAAIERDEQERIKAQMREEQKLQKEVDRELKQLERERAAIQVTLEKAMAESKDQHCAEIEQLKARLAEAEEKSKRAISQAQLTRTGHIYVISNVGSFGKDVFKIGMTRRLEPKERVHELSSASVPFPFDIHMMIFSKDAPTLETALHYELRKLRVNKVNPRKEFFKAEIDAIRKIVEEKHGQVQYVADPEALEYNQSLTMTDEDSEFVQHVWSEAEDDGEDAVGDQ